VFALYPEKRYYLPADHYDTKHFAVETGRACIPSCSSRSQQGNWMISQSVEMLSDLEIRAYATPLRHAIPFHNPTRL